MRFALLLPLAAFSLYAQTAVDSDVQAFIPFLQWSTRVDPVWPTEARSLDLQTEVQLLVKLDTSGSVVSAEPLSGLAILRQPAIDAIRQWRFQPVIREGRAVIAMTTEAIYFFQKPGKKFQPAPPEESRRASERIFELTRRFPRSDSQVLADLEQSLVGSSTREQGFQLSALAKAAFRAGDWSKAVSYANEALSTSHGGDAVHDGNLVLGLVALKNGDLVNARIHLLKAGESTGSPVLGSFGPNMNLAKGLLEAGERDTVLQYFGECRTFWKMGVAKLDAWSATVRGGGMPDFGTNLIY